MGYDVRMERDEGSHSTEPDRLSDMQHTLIQFAKSPNEERTALAL